MGSGFTLIYSAAGLAALVLFSGPGPLCVGLALTLPEVAGSGGGVLLLGLPELYSGDGPFGCSGGAHPCCFGFEPAGLVVPWTCGGGCLFPRHFSLSNRAHFVVTTGRSGTILMPDLPVL